MINNDAYKDYALRIMILAEACYETLVRIDFKEFIPSSAAYLSEIDVGLFNHIWLKP